MGRQRHGVLNLNENLQLWYLTVTPKIRLIRLLGLNKIQAVAVGQRNDYQGIKWKSGLVLELQWNKRRVQNLRLAG